MNQKSYAPIGGYKIMNLYAAFKDFVITLCVNSFIHTGLCESVFGKRVLVYCEIL